MNYKVKNNIRTTNILTNAFSKHQLAPGLKILAGRRLETPTLDRRKLRMGGH